MSDKQETAIAVRKLPPVGGSFTLDELEAYSARVAEVGEQTALAELQASRAPAELPAVVAAGAVDGAQD